MEERQKKKEIKEKGSVQGFEICNVEGSLKGEKKKQKRWSLQVLLEKTESLKATHLPALPFLSNGCLSDFLPPFIHFQTVYKCWQNLPALVEVSLHLNSFFGYKNFILCFNSFFWVQNFYALFILIWDALFIYLFIYFRLFVFVFILFEHPWQPHTIDVVADDQGRGSLQYWRRAEPVNNVSERRSRD